MTLMQCCQMCSLIILLMDDSKGSEIELAAMISVCVEIGVFTLILGVG